MTDSTEVAAEPWTLPRQLVGAAGYVEHLPRGPRAILRRLRQHPDDVPPDVFWVVVDRYDIAAANEPFWTALLPLMVHHPHRPIRPGEAMARAGLKPARVERWLRLDHRDRATSEAHRLLSKLESGLDWAEFGQLLWYWSDDRRRRLARDFFLSPHLRRD